MNPLKDISIKVWIFIIMGIILILYFLIKILGNFQKSTILIGSFSILVICFIIFMYTSMKKEYAAWREKYG